VITSVPRDMVLLVVSLNNRSNSVECAVNFFHTFSRLLNKNP
jgi:hypothetical protein